MNRDTSSDTPIFNDKDSYNKQHPETTRQSRDANQDPRQDPRRKVGRDAVGREAVVRDGGEAANSDAVTEGSAVTECDEPVPSQAACDAIKQAGFTATSPQNESEEHHAEKTEPEDSAQSAKRSGSRDADSIARDSNPHGKMRPKPEGK